MPSPFPGMDPYLEDPVYWPDALHGFATYLRDELRPLISPAYYAHVGERVYVAAPPEVIIPDVAVVKLQAPPPAGVQSSTLLADAPTVILAPKQEIHEPFVKIMDARHGGHIVTVIEILSPTNKIFGSDGYRKYREKQQDVLASDSHLVEIDLLRGGAHVVAFNLESFPPPRVWDAVICVNRAEARDQFEIYHRTIRERLPKIAIPLTVPDADVVVDLQGIIEKCYAEGSYEYLFDYIKSPPTPLRDSDQAWAAALASARR